MVDESVNFIGRLAREIIRITDPKWVVLLLHDNLALSVKLDSYGTPWSIFSVVQYAGLCGLVGKGAQSYSKPFFSVVRYAGLCGLVGKGAQSYSKPWSIFPVVLYAGTVAMYWHVWLHGSYLTKAAEVKRDFYVQYSGWESFVYCGWCEVKESLCAYVREWYIYIE